MRVTYLSNSCIPSRSANSVHVMKMCGALAELGHEVLLVAPGRVDCREKDAPDLFSYYGVAHSFKITFRPWLPVPGRSFLYGLFAALAAVSWRSSLAYGRHLFALYLAALFGRPVMAEVHAPLEGEMPIIRWVFGRLLRSGRFRGVIVITDALKRHYEEYWPELRGRITVVPDAADPVPDGLLPVALSCRPGALNVGYVGSLYRGKGMEVIADLAPLCPWADFHIVGGGEGEVNDWTAACAGLRNIFFYGHVPPSEAVRYIQSFDVVLLPNQEEVGTYGSVSGDIGRWTSPLKMFEYMAAGMAIVASDLPVLKEVLEDGRNALLCSPVNVDAWRDALERLNGDREIRNRIASEAKADFDSSYSWKERARKIMEMLTK